MMKQKEEAFFTSYLCASHRVLSVRGCEGRLGKLGGTFLPASGMLGLSLNLAGTACYHLIKAIVRSGSSNGHQLRLRPRSLIGAVRYRQHAACAHQRVGWRHVCAWPLIPTVELIFLLHTSTRRHGIGRLVFVPCVAIGP